MDLPTESMQDHKRLALVRTVEEAKKETETYKTALKNAQGRAEEVDNMFCRFKP